jgi:hypothetical protein
LGITNFAFDPDAIANAPSVVLLANVYSSYGFGIGVEQNDISFFD